MPKQDWNDLERLRAGRAQMEKQAMAAMGPPPPQVTETRHTITLRDGHKSELKIHRPSNASAKGAPLIVLVFGGGFMLGNNDQLTPYARGLVRLYNAVVVNVTYRLAPEHAFPTAPNDCWDSLQWLAANASSEPISADPAAGFILGGVSAGGNITAALSQMNLDLTPQGKGLAHPLTGIWACVPLLVPDESFLPDEEKHLWFSREQNAGGPIIDADAMAAITKALKPDPKSEWYSPLNAKKPFVGMPRSYVQVNGLDPLRDDGLIYERMLRQAGVETRLTVWPGLPHAHFAFMPTLNVSKKAVVDTLSGFGWLLRKEVSLEQIQSVFAAPAAA